MFRDVKEFYNGVKLVTVDHKTENIETCTFAYGVYLVEEEHDCIDYSDGNSRGVYFNHLPGQLTFSPPSGVRADFPSGKISHTRVELPAQKILVAANDNCEHHMEVLRGVQDEAMAHTVRAFKNVGPNPDPLFVDHLTMAVSYRANSWFSVQMAANDKYFGRIGRAIEYMNDNIEKPATMAELASVACMSEFHFARQFKRVTGMPPHRYMVEKRVEKAKRLLAKTAASIAVIALACGFSSQSHLSTTFKARVGLSPLGYQRAIGREQT